jgi:hypothetical protein
MCNLLRSSSPLRVRAAVDARATFIKTIVSFCSGDGDIKEALHCCTSCIESLRCDIFVKMRSASRRVDVSPQRNAVLYIRSTAGALSRKKDKSYKSYKIFMLSAALGAILNLDSKLSTKASRERATANMLHINKNTIVITFRFVILVEFIGLKLPLQN